jgi:hypothetical protein
MSRLAYESHFHSSFWPKSQSDDQSLDESSRIDEDYDEDCDTGEASEPEDQDDEEISVT